MAVDALTLIVNRNMWGNKIDPAYYDYTTQTIRVRDDYIAQMSKTNPLTNHWVAHAVARHIIFKAFGVGYTNKSINIYPDTRVERFAFAYQFRYLKQHKACDTLRDLYSLDSFFRHKRIYNASLEYYWNNSSVITDEIEKQII